VTLDPDFARELRRHWSHLIDLAVFGDLKSSRIGAMPRLRKRTLEAGERLRALGASREWIPHPREQIKNALASALHLRESLDQLESAAAELDGGADLAAFRGELAGLRDVVLARLPAMENRYAALLDAEYRQQPDEE
jgi:hypothetical protein